tara:strand:+ start:723 stop:1649 length:927 start_codon:yes stop_codon:yes gene_type:complete
MIKYNLKLFSYNAIFLELVHLEQNNKLPSRILLAGQEDIGKTTFSLHLINYLLSKNEESKYDINDNQINSKSHSYKFINNLTHPNFYLIEKSQDKKNIDVEQIRKMIYFLNKSSLDNNRKIILIDGVENLNLNSSNALLKSLEESGEKNLFILTHNSNKNLLDTIKSRCLIYKLNFNYSYNKNIINSFFNQDLYSKLNDDFKSTFVAPGFLIKHISFAQDNNIELNSLNIKSMIQYIIDNKSYKKNDFITDNFQTYIEIFFTKMYSKTKDYKYYDNFLKIITENNLINKFNLDLDSFFVKFENKYLNI